MRSLLIAAFFVGLAGAASATPLALAYSVGPGSQGAYETFDSMGATGTRAPGAPSGAAWDSYWSVVVEGVIPTEQYDDLRLPIAAQRDGYNGGAVGGSDRALGVYTTANGNPARYMTALFRNDTGSVLAGFALEFDVEHWLQANNGRWAGLQAWISLDGTNFVDLGNAFESVRVSTTGAGWVDGNAAANSVRGVGGAVALASYGLPGVASGGTFYLRFSASQGLTIPGGMSINQNRQGAGFLDNLWVGTVDRATGLAATPEPGSGALLALGLLAMACSARAARA